MLGRIVFACALLILVNGCELEQSKEIEWQLPLSVPDDPHGSTLGNELPEWATTMEGKATVVFLQKKTTRLSEVTLENGSKATLGNWHVELLGLATGLRVKDHSFINDESASNPAAFARLSLHGKVMYEGWLYKDFPELFGMDNSDWKVWLQDVIMPPSSQEDDNLLP